jgi:hypothetical protein
MAAVEIPFPKSSQPGQEAGEGYGRLLNAWCDVDAGTLTWRPVPGSKMFVELEKDTHRGMIVVDGVLRTLQDDRFYNVTRTGSIDRVIGSIGGDGPITLAQNNAKPIRGIVGVSTAGAFSVTATAVFDLDTSNLPAPNSVCSLDGYFLYTCADGRVFASDLNTPNINALSFTAANADPDGLVRGTSHGGQFFAWGQTSTEVYQNVGTQPFPLQRVTVIPVGLIGPWAIAGFEEGFNGDQVFVASDGTVRRMNGYDPVRVSTRDVERAINSVKVKSQIQATAYVFDGNQIISFSVPGGTWEYNLRTGFWHERRTQEQKRWFGCNAVLFNERWVVARYDNSHLVYIDSREYKDDLTDISMLVESAPLKDFPMRSVVSAAFFDWTVGQGSLSGEIIQVEPTVAISWSRDGGEIFGNEILCRLGTEGEYSKTVRVNRLGMASQHGMRIRLMTSSPVHRVLRGGKVEFTARGPA